MGGAELLFEEGNRALGTERRRGGREREREREKDREGKRGCVGNGRRESNKYGETWKRTWE